MNKKIITTAYRFILISLACAIGLVDSASAISQEQRKVFGREVYYYNTEKSATCAANANTGGNTIVLDPGHGGEGKNIERIDPETGLRDGDYFNNPETVDMFKVASQLQEKLKADGYNVLMTKQNADQSVFLRDRANVGNTNNAALGVSIHYQSNLSWHQLQEIYVQKVGLYRGSGENRTEFTDAAVADKSQSYANIFKTEREKVEGGTIKIKDNSFDGRGEIEPGNIPLVQLFAKVPWVYNEVGGGAGYDEAKYVTSLYNSIKTAVPITTPAAIDPATTPTGNNNQIAYQYFRGMDFTPEQAAAIMGNLIVESQKDDGIIHPDTHQNGGGKGRGIAQWSVDERWVDLVQFARNQNRSEWDLMTQLDFIKHEFSPNGSEKKAYNAFKPVTNDLPKAVEIFVKEYERAGKPHLQARIEWANKILAQYSGLPGTGGAGGCNSTGGAGGGSIAQIALAEWEKGVVEQPQGCDAGNRSIKGTCGPEVDKYTDSTLEYWCADFVSWVYREAGTPFTGGMSGGWRIPGTRTLADWFRQNGQFFDRGDANYTPQPGDVVFYSYSHVDIIVAVNGSTMTVVGGNTSGANDRNGDGVGKKDKPVNSASIYGYGRLK